MNSQFVSQMESDNSKRRSTRGELTKNLASVQWTGGKASRRHDHMPSTERLEEASYATGEAEKDAQCREYEHRSNGKSDNGLDRVLDAEDGTPGSAALGSGHAGRRDGCRFTS